MTKVESASVPRQMTLKVHLWFKARLLKRQTVLSISTRTVSSRNTVSQTLQVDLEMFTNVR